MVKNRFVGIEFEISGQAYDSWEHDLKEIPELTNWVIKGDSSIPYMRSEKTGRSYYGVELVTPKSQFGVSLVNQIDFAYAKIDQLSEVSGLICNHYSSYEQASCGLHVHVDSSGFEKSHFGAAIAWTQINWDTLAKRFPEILPAWRKNWRFCKNNPMVESSRNIEAVAQNDHDACAKFRAVSTIGRQYYNRDTIEYRLGAMSPDKEQVIAWVKYFHDLTTLIGCFTANDLKSKTCNQLCHLLEQYHDSDLNITFPEENVEEVAA